MRLIQLDTTQATTTLTRTMITTTTTTTIQHDHGTRHSLILRRGVISGAGQILILRRGVISAAFDRLQMMVYELCQCLPPRRGVITKATTQTSPIQCSTTPSRHFLRLRGQTLQAQTIIAFARVCQGQLSRASTYAESVVVPRIYVQLLEPHVVLVVPRREGILQVNGSKHISLIVF